MSSRAPLSLYVAFVALGAVAACSAAADSKSKKEPVIPGDEYWSFDDDVDPDPLVPDEVNDDSGAFTVSSRPKEGGIDVVDAGTDASAPTACKTPVGPGDLAIVELTISSRSGSGDFGEWFEVKNTRDCISDVGGLVVSSPRGTLTDSFTVPIGTMLQPGETFVGGNSTDATKNNSLPGLVFSFEKADVLKNDGDTITIVSGSTTVDSITYPKFGTSLAIGVSLEFPADCPPATNRGDWARWSVSGSTFSTGQKGTPNAPNADVTCF